MRFDRKGNLLATIKLEAQDTRAWDDPVISPRGTIMALVRGGTSDKTSILVWDLQGKRVKQAETTLKLAINQAWTALPGDRKVGLGVGLKCLPDGRLIVSDGYLLDPDTGGVAKVAETTSSPQINLHRGFLYGIETAESGKPSSMWWVRETGEVDYSDSSWHEGTRYKVVVYDAMGRLLREFQLPAGSPSDVEKQVPYTTAVLAVDGRGHVYLERFPRVVYDVPVGATHAVRYSAVLEYDSSGRFVGLRAICNTFSFLSISVDAQGNVYWLEPHKDGLHVMMAPVPQ